MKYVAVNSTMGVCKWDSECMCMIEYVFVCMMVCMSMYVVCLCVCVCVWERDKEIKWFGKYVKSIDIMVKLLSNK